MERDSSEQLNELASALVLAQAEMSDAKKDRQNPHLKTNYATLGSVWDACREPLTKHGLCVIQRVLPNEDTARIRLETVLLHKSGQYICGIEDLPLTKPNDPQAYGAALTYARRYGLSAMVGVCPAEDLDNEPPAGNRPPQRPQQQRQDAPQQRRDIHQEAETALRGQEKPAASMVANGGPGASPATPSLGALDLPALQRQYGETYQRVTGRRIATTEDKAAFREFTATALDIPDGFEWSFGKLTAAQYQQGLTYLAHVERQKREAA